jgi:hypothetical protein
VPTPDCGKAKIYYGIDRSSARQVQSNFDKREGKSHVAPAGSEEIRRGESSVLSISIGSPLTGLSRSEDYPAERCILPVKRVRTHGKPPAYGLLPLKAVPLIEVGLEMKEVVCDCSTIS